MVHNQHQYHHHVKRKPLRVRILHAAIVGLRITAVIIAVHFAVRFLELHGIFTRLGKTADFACGSVIDYLLSGIGEGGIE